MGADVVAQAAVYGLELVDALTGGPLVGASAVVETSSRKVPYLVNASRWVFSALPAGPATFAITADGYVAQTVPTGVALPSGVTLPDPNPMPGTAGYLATIPMMPRTGYPFPPTLTRVVGLVKFGASPVPGARVTLKPSHFQSPSTVDDPTVDVVTTDDGQYTYWFLPRLSEAPPIANKLSGSASATIGGTPRSGVLASIDLVPNGVNIAPTITLA